MDGAGKFVRGDAVAGVLITARQHRRRPVPSASSEHGMAPAEAVEVFTKLTIGDGLVARCRPS